MWPSDGSSDLPIETSSSNRRAFYPLAGLWRGMSLALDYVFPHPARFTILMMHGVSHKEMASFEALIEHLLENHGILSPAEVEKALDGHGLETQGRIPVLLTFDDGFASNATVAHRILDRYCLRAVFFVCPGLMEMHPDERMRLVERNMFADPLPPGVTPEQLLTWDDCESLLASGHTIGSHTFTHTRLSALSQSQQMEEIHDAADLLEKRLQRRPDWFAYPFGNLDSIDSFSLSQIALRHRYNCTGLRGFNTARSEPLGLLREHMQLDCPFSYQKMILAGGLQFRYAAKRRRFLDMLHRATRSSNVHSTYHQHSDLQPR